MIKQKNKVNVFRLEKRVSHLERLLKHQQRINAHQAKLNEIEMFDREVLAKRLSELEPIVLAKQPPFKKQGVIRRFLTVFWQFLGR
ncbi:hypothetical protein [Caviibacterium pharyngocola]|uniref:Uncharacterized protein n=1 Tax=Caviibacterium pharyngocola TaxID=28159 RepID=A0A2M8RTF8_9PAST|nr:hypothetical protein [Caviibacterium pharyngocola]PJG82149.1 hypothetical protein CVP04_10865 [Caviibacterium pharyngocola]